MNIPVQLFIYLLAILIYFIYKKKKGLKNQEILKRLGLSFSYSTYYLLGVLFSILSLLVAWVIFYLFPIEEDLLKQTSYKNYNISTFSLIPVFLIFVRELVFIAFGEELLFRGLFGGHFFRKFSYVKANIFQTIIFLIPHILLLFVSLKLLPILFLTFLSGWLLGWLRYKSDSIFPGVLMHSLTNTISIIVFYI
ncbi:CPBP family intramembrane glutamic endopeptidase [Chryseobacterium indoltheticum]|uniref:CAAX amino terminal protease self- immunity n=1 Tax=Chryseobacterium indoltheticum TaxID=254 RepID=A0A381FBX2_9FLAO|nr:CPBP family intramembrane glutamic endopeptidase [Chryseobacterium indoltheticum]SUX43968.1 CAAX amino terminal protease self- immunity [Chryseobacterium indoltheticum]